MGKIPKHGTLLIISNILQDAKPESWHVLVHPGMRYPGTLLVVVISGGELYDEWVLGDFWDKNLNKTEYFKEVSATTCSIGIQGYRKRFGSDQGLGCTKRIGHGMSPGTFI